MLRLRIIVPPDRSDEVVDLLRVEPGGRPPRGAARQRPASRPGDVVLADVAREGANAVLDQLRALRVDQEGAIVIEHAGVMLSAAARRAARRAPGMDVDAVVWDELETVTGQETRLSATYLALLIVATIIASIGVLLDQPILIVGAMVVGPEFGPLAALSVGLVRRHWPVVRHSSLALGVGFPSAILATAGAHLDPHLARAGRQVDAAGAAAAHRLHLAPGRPVVGDRLPGRRRRHDLGDVGPSGALIGVLISVTTVPGGGQRLGGARLRRHGARPAVRPSSC